ncbi:uncharacterized protein LOC119081916 [Bradysia coprophila]|uniref:uncharacterized protein LOC119081916 n=1 Tax=Bradysia coprophila TaxID=38358 RepID=UPI00187D81E0|nr:uncharacterized protein LOC119081916 [Bradysia coprophila]XP_037047048.1 uncharacterized protein LOC119081916 [Bradysia coprophila]
MSTPQRPSLNTSVYSPVRFPDTLLSPKSPKADPLGIRLKVRSIVKTVMENHKKWELAQKRGIALCSTIENVKKEALDRIASEPSTTLYPDELKTPSEKLKTITTILKDVLDSSKECLSQLNGLKKLQSNTNERLLKSWTIVKVMNAIEAIVHAYEDEYDVKVTVMENVCHSSSKEEIAFHVTVWEFETFVNDDVRFMLFGMQVECDIDGNS